MSEETAYHEAGHAVVASRLGGEVRAVTIEPDWDDGPERYGDTQVAWPAAMVGRRDFAHKLVLVALAGPVAEMAYRGERIDLGQCGEWAEDWRQAWGAASAVAPEEHRRRRYLEQAAEELETLLGDALCWAAVAAVADALLAHDRLEQEELAEVIGPWFG